MSTVKGVWRFRPHIMEMNNIQYDLTENVKFRWYPCDWPESKRDVGVASVTTYYYEPEDQFSQFYFYKDGKSVGRKKIIRKTVSDTQGLHTTYPTNTYQGWYIRYTNSNKGLCWSNGSISEPMFIDFGEEEQEVSDQFFEWLNNNAVPQIPAECSYRKETSILNRGHINTLPCQDKYMLDDITIKNSPLPSWIEYDGEKTFIDSDKTIILPCAGKKMKTDIIIDNTKEYPENYSYNLILPESTTTSLTLQLKCSIGDLIVAAIVTRDSFIISDGWNLISTSDVHSADTINQTLSWAYKFAENTTETITVTQASEQRLYINAVALPGATGVIDNGYSYTESGTTLITLTKPNRFVLWGMTAPLWSTNSYSLQDIWTISNNSFIIQPGGAFQGRLGLALDDSNDETVTISGSEQEEACAIIGCLIVQGMDKLQ